MQPVRHTGASRAAWQMATQAQKLLPLPSSHTRKERTREYALAPIDRAVASLDAAMKEPDLGEEKATTGAIEKARELLNSVSFWVGSIPEPDTIFSLDGGVQVAWKNDELHLHLRLFCAPVLSKSYIYVSQTARGKTHASALLPADVFTLADGLRWLRTSDWPMSSLRS